MVQINQKDCQMKKKALLFEWVEELLAGLDLLKIQMSDLRQVEGLDPIG